MRRIIDGPRPQPSHDQPPAEPKHGDDVRGYTNDLQKRFPQDTFRLGLSGLLTRGIKKPQDLRLASVLVADAYAHVPSDEHDETDQDGKKETRRQAARFTTEMFDSTYLYTSEEDGQDAAPSTLGDTLATLKNIRGSHLGDRAMNELQSGVNKAQDIADLLPIIEQALVSFATVLGESAHRGRTTVAIAQSPEFTRDEQQKMVVFKIVDSLVRAKKTLINAQGIDSMDTDARQKEMLRKITLAGLGLPESFGTSQIDKKQEPRPAVSTRPQPQEEAPVFKQIDAKKEKREMTAEQIIEEALRVGGFQILSRFSPKILKDSTVHGFQTVGTKLASSDTSRSRGQWILNEINGSKGKDKGYYDEGEFLKKEKIKELVGISPVEHLATDQKPKIVPEDGIRFEDAIEGADPQFGREHAIQFFYHTSGSDWKNEERGGQIMECTIVLPQSLATLFEKAMREDPTIIRTLIGRHMKQDVLRNPDDWERPGEPVGNPKDEPWSRTQPPWEMWDKPEAGIRGMYIRKRGSAEGVQESDIIPIHKK